VFLDDQALPCGPRTVWWSETDDFTPLERLATGMALDISDCARRFATVELPAEEMRLWDYHPVLGFFRHGDD
jgi:CRISPR-associated endonuclease/helicase Cas3